jgi:hypothetical protein
MKKTILLATILTAGILTAGSVKAQYFNGSIGVYVHGANGYGRGYAGVQGTYGYGGVVYQRSDKYRDLDRINWLKQAMREDAYCGNWQAYHQHEAELQYLYRDVEHDRFEERRQSEIWHREHDYRDGGYEHRDRYQGGDFR